MCPLDMCLSICLWQIYNNFLHKTLKVIWHLWVLPHFRHISKWYDRILIQIWIWKSSDSCPTHFIHILTQFCNRQFAEISDTFLKLMGPELALDKSNLENRFPHYVLNIYNIICTPSAQKKICQCITQSWAENCLYQGIEKENYTGWQENYKLSKNWGTRGTLVNIWHVTA